MERDGKKRKEMRKWRGGRVRKGQGGGELPPKYKYWLA